MWTSLDSAYYDLYLALWTGVATIASVIAERSRRIAGRAGWLGVAFGLAHIPFLCLWAGAARESWVALPGGEVGLWYLWYFSADLAAYLLPNPNHPLWRSVMTGPTRAFHGEWVVTIGILPWIMTIGATWRVRREPGQVRLWVIVFWLFLLLSLGPFLNWLGENTGVRLPFYLLRNVPVLREARVLSRYSVLVALAAAVLTGVGLAWLVKQRKARPQVVYGLAALLVLFELLPAPLTLADRAVPPVYRQIAADGGDGAVLDLPFGVNDSFGGIGGWNPQAMYYQSATGRPIVGAHVSRTPERVFDGYEQMAIIGRLARIERGESFTEADVAADRMALAEVIERLDLDYIVAPVEYIGSAGYDYVVSVFGTCLAAIREDGVKVGYRVRRPCP
jgi:hypothetical protein